MTFTMDVRGRETKQRSNDKRKRTSCFLNFHNDSTDTFRGFSGGETPYPMNTVIYTSITPRVEKATALPAAPRQTKPNPCSLVWCVCLCCPCSDRWFSRSVQFFPIPPSVLSYHTWPKCVCVCFFVAAQFCCFKRLTSLQQRRERFPCRDFSSCPSLLKNTGIKLCCVLYCFSHPDCSPFGTVRSSCVCVLPKSVCVCIFANPLTRKVRRLTSRRSGNRAVQGR